MHHERTKSYFLLALLLATLVLVFFIFRPFLYALILAAVVALVFQPFHQRIFSLFKGHHALAALCSTLVIMIVILTPLIFLGVQIFQEAEQFYFWAIQNHNATFFNLSPEAANTLSIFFPTVSLPSDFDFYITKGLSWLLAHLNVIFSNLATFFVNFFIFMVALYYILKDGQTIKKAIITISPLANRDDESIFQRLENAVHSVVKGSLIVAFVQGTLAGIGFTFFHVPNPTLWGIVTVIAALIPGIGTALIVIPAIIYLFLSGNTVAAIGLLAWGALVVGLVDNFLRPKLIERGLKLHPLMIFLSVFGGIVLFGPMGILLGPLALSFFFALLHIYLATPLLNTLEAEGF